MTRHYTQLLFILQRGNEGDVFAFDPRLLHYQCIPGRIFVREDRQVSRDQAIKQFIFVAARNRLRLQEEQIKQLPSFDARIRFLVLKKRVTIRPLLATCEHLHGVQGAVPFNDLDAVFRSGLAVPLKAA